MHDLGKTAGYFESYEEPQIALNSAPYQQVRQIRPRMPSILLRVSRHMPSELRVSRWDLLNLWESDRWMQCHLITLMPLLNSSRACTHTSSSQPEGPVASAHITRLWSMDNLAGGHTLGEKWLEDTVSLLSNYSLCMLICILTLHILTHSLRCLCTVKSQCTFLVLLIEVLKWRHQGSTLAYIENLKYLQCLIIP